VILEIADWVAEWDYSLYKTVTCLLFADNINSNCNAVHFIDQGSDSQTS